MRRWACLGLAGLLALLVGSRCGGGGGPLLAITLNAVPEPYNDLLVVPPSGFTVDVTFLDPAAILPETLSLSAYPWNAELPVVDLGPGVLLGADGAVWLVPESTPLSPGSYTIVVTASEAGGGSTSDVIDVAVRNHPLGAPLEFGQWIQLDTSLDADGNGTPDFREDLPSFGLGSAADPSSWSIVESWVRQEMVARAQAFYDAPNPSGLPGGDPLDLTFSDVAPEGGPFTRICVGGADPTGGSTIGNVLYDAGNVNPSQVACDEFLPSGVFPREILFYGFDPTFQAVFGPLQASPVGTDPLDPVVLGPSYDPGDPAQLARFQQIERGVEAFAQAVATVAAHEAGHALGLVAPGVPGGGLFGGSTGPADTHNVDESGAAPTESLLMNQGNSFSFEELAGEGGVPLPGLRHLNFAYLQGRLVLDASVTGIFPPPIVASVSPGQLSLDGPSIVTITVTGNGFLELPSLRLLGPTLHSAFGESLVSATEMTGSVLVPQLVAGVYDLEVTNPDGQRDVLTGALQIVP